MPTFRVFKVARQFDKAESVGLILRLLKPVRQTCPQKIQGTHSASPSDFVQRT